MKFDQSTNQHNNNTISNTIIVIACIFCLTVTFYLISFSGVPISDDEQLYASAARNVATNGRISAEQLYGNLRLNGSYHGVEPAFPVLASIWYRLFLHTDFGHLQSLYLLPIFFTAASSAMITLIASQLKYQNQTGAIAGILFGLSTMAWPYAKTLFREPLISLLLLCSLSTFLLIIMKDRHILAILSLAVVFSMLLVLLFLTKVAMLIVPLAFFIIWIFIRQGIKERREQKIVVIVCALIIVLELFFYLLSPKATDSNIFYRFSNSFLRDAIVRLISIPHSHLLEALFAPLVSPWKGLIFYSPVCLLGVASFVRFRKNRPELIILPVSTLIALLLIQALAYDNEWWTPTWGSRFLLPVIPLMIVASLPIIEELVDGKRGKIILGSLFVIGFLIQLPAIFFNSAEFTATTYLPEESLSSSFIWSFFKTPIITQWASIETQQPDLLLWRTFITHPTMALTILILVIGLITISIFYLYKALIGNIFYKGQTGLYLGISIFAVPLITILILHMGSFDPLYHSQEFEQICIFINNNIQPGNTVIVRPYPGPAWQYLMNNECGQKIWYSLPNNDDTPSKPNVLDQLSELAAQDVSTNSGIFLIDQFWSTPFTLESEEITLINYDLIYKRYFNDSYGIFVGFYAPKSKK